MKLEPNVHFEALSAGRGTWEIINGVEHYVAPIVAMVQGVVHAMNAKRPEFVPGDQLSTYGWDGRPVFINHPMVDDVPVASFHPKVANTHIGFTRNPSVIGEGDDRKLVMEVCLEKMKLTPELLSHVDSDDPFNVSMGAFVNSVKAEGEYKGKKYYSEWHDIDPDHMALLPATKGACSWEMGCGVRAAGELRAAWMDKSGVDDHGRGAHEAAANAHLDAAYAHGQAAKAHEQARAGGANSTEYKKAAAEATRAAHSETKSAQALTMGNREAGPNSYDQAKNSFHAGDSSRAAQVASISREHDKAAAAHKEAANSHRLQAQYHQHRASMDPRRAEDNMDMDTELAELVAHFSTLRDISQDERDKLPKEDFAGPNESFPIVEAVDVHNAAQSLGRAKGNRAAIKRKIISIAYRKGFEAQLPDDWKKKSDAKAMSMFARAMKAVQDALRPAMDADMMSSNQLNSKLWEALKEIEPRCSSVIDVFPVLDPSHVVYQTFTPSADPMGYGTYELLERSFTISDGGVITLGPTAIEVETVVTYEPVEGATPLAAEARVEAAPCGCKGKTTAAAETIQQEEITMEKQARIKALIAASNGMFGEADMKMLEGATDEQLARYEAAAQATNKTLTDAAAAVTAASAKTDPTFGELLDKAPADVQAAIKGQIKAAADKKEATIKVLTDSGRCNFTKEQLANFDQASLDNLVTLAAIKPAVDHSLVLPPAANEGADKQVIVAQTNEGFNAKVKAKQDAAKAAKK